MSLADKFFQKADGLQSIYNELHRLQLILKLSHYKTKSYAAHEAFGKIYSTVEAMTDEITEQLIGYSGTDPDKLEIGAVSFIVPGILAHDIMVFADKLQAFAAAKKYSNIENLAQELSGAGAKLKYLSRFA